MKKLLLSFSLIIIFTSSLYAVGIGGYTSITYHNYYPRNVLLGGGIVIDTACASDKIFNFRLYAGFDQSCPIEHKEILSRIKSDNIFGFSVFRNDLIRIWIGPNVGLHYLYTRISYLNNNDIFKNNSGSFIYTDYKYRLFNKAFGMPVGISFGLNININDYFTLSFDLSGRLNFYFGQLTQQYFRIYSIPVAGNTVVLPMKKYNPNYIKGGFDSSCNISFIYRINDKYTKK